MSSDMHWFAKNFDLPLGEVSEISKDVKKDFPRDEMMYKLHLIRALMQREEEKKKLSFAEMQRFRRRRTQKGLAEVGYKLVNTGHRTLRIVKMK